MEKVLDKILGKLDNLDDRFGKLENRFDKLENRFDKLENRFDNLENRFDKLENRFDNLENRFGNLENRFDKLNREVNVLKVGLHEMKNEHGAILRGIEEKVSVRNAQIDSLEINVARITGTLSGCGDALSRLRQAE